MFIRICLLRRIFELLYRLHTKKILKKFKFLLIFELPNFSFEQHDGHGEIHCKISHRFSPYFPVFLFCIFKFFNVLETRKVFQKLKVCRIVNSQKIRISQKLTFLSFSERGLRYVFHYRRSLQCVAQPIVVAALGVAPHSPVLLSKKP